MKNNKLILSGFISTITAVSLLLTTDVLAKQTDESGSRLDAYGKLRKVINTVENYYVDEIPIDDVIDKAIDGMLSNLDAHSSYLSKKKFKELKIQTEGEFGGLGITVGMRDEALTVIAPIDDTPAYKAGLKSGDIILKIGDKSTLNMTIDEAVSLMRGKPGTKITLTIVRKKEPKPFDVTITRDIIVVKSVHAKKIEDEELLYIRVSSFDKHVVDNVRDELKKNASWMKGVVLDLRNNPGGLLDQAVGLCDLFIDSGVIVSQKGRSESENRDFKATKAGTYENIPLTVLVNNGSASASEIVSGSLQDHKKAIIVGEKTFGKGSVQVILPLDDEEGLRLTIARYYLPSGRTIQAVGVTPDIIVYPGEVPNDNGDFKLKESELKKHLENELKKIEPENQVLGEDETALDENSATVTKENVYRDIQLKSAIDVLKAWNVFKK